MSCHMKVTSGALTELDASEGNWQSEIPAILYDK